MRLLSDQLHELPEPTDEARTIDYFRVSLQVGQLKGNKSVKVLWRAHADIVESNESISSPLVGAEDKSKIKVKALKQQYASSSPQLNTPHNSASHNTRNLRNLNTRTGRVTTQDLPAGSNVNLGKSW